MDNWLPRHRFTVDEYCRMAEVGLLAPNARVELIEGQIIDKPHPRVTNGARAVATGDPKPMTALLDDGSPGHRFTVDEFYRMAEVGLLDEDARVELIEGEIIDMPPPGSLHSGTVDWLNRLFCAAVRVAATFILTRIHIAPLPRR
jgi:Uma2 family endonuclease